MLVVDGVDASIVIDDEHHHSVIPLITLLHTLPLSCVLHQHTPFSHCLLLFLSVIRFGLSACLYVQAFYPPTPPCPPHVFLLTVGLIVSECVSSFLGTACVLFICLNIVLLYFVLFVVWFISLFFFSFLFRSVWCSCSIPCSLFLLN